MRFEPTDIPDVVVVELEPIADDRGFFARAFCVDELAAAGLVTDWVQANMSRNHRAGTLRGLHWQAEPDAEAKLVRCTSGRVVDVAVDVRADSPTRHRHVAVELDAESGRALYVPPGFAHGYQTLVDDTDLLYMVSARYAPASERGLRHDDPALGIDWPLPPTEVSAKDLAWPLLAD